MLPTHGQVMSVFFLANALRHKAFDSLDAWVAEAASASSFLAAAVDHRPVAEFLIARDFVKRLPALSIGHELRSASEVADQRTLLAIAGLLLEVNPPEWLASAARSGRLREELIPVEALASLDWLRPDLDTLLLAVAAKTESRASSILGLGIGRAAELVILASLENAGVSPLHVAELSDLYGYDIETLGGPYLKWEVKGATKATSQRFHLTRHEFDQARRFRDDWCLVQVEFVAEALGADRISVEHVSRSRLLTPADLDEIAPNDSPAFRWEASAVFAPTSEQWRTYDLRLPLDFGIADLRTLGAEALARRETAVP